MSGLRRLFKTLYPSFARKQCARAALAKLLAKAGRRLGRRPRKKCGVPAIPGFSYADLLRRMCLIFIFFARSPRNASG